MVEVIVALPNLKAAPRIHARYPFLLPVGGSRRPSAANSSLATDEVANPTYALFCGYSTRIEPELSPFSWTNVATSQTGRKDWPPTQSPAHLLHSIQDVYTISVHALEPSFQRAG